MGFRNRKATPDQTFEFTDAEGKLKTFKADDKGIVRPASAEEEAVADSFGLPLATEAKNKEED